MVWVGGVGTRGMGKRGRAEDKGKNQRDDLIGIIKEVTAILKHFKVFLCFMPNYMAFIRFNRDSIWLNSRFIMPLRYRQSHHHLTWSNTQDITSVQLFMDVVQKEKWVLLTSLSLFTLKLWTKLNSAWSSKARLATSQHVAGHLGGVIVAKTWSIFDTKDPFFALPAFCQNRWDMTTL